MEYAAPPRIPSAPAYSGGTGPGQLVPSVPGGPAGPAGPAEPCGPWEPSGPVGPSQAGRASTRNRAAARRRFIGYLGRLEGVLSRGLFIRSHGWLPFGKCYAGCRGPRNGWNKGPSDTSHRRTCQPIRSCLTGCQSVEPQRALGDIEISQLPIQVPLADPQNAGGVSAVAGHRPEHTLHMDPLHLGQGREGPAGLRNQAGG